MKQPDIAISIYDAPLPWLDLIRPSASSHFIRML